MLKRITFVQISKIRCLFILLFLKTKIIKFVLKTKIVKLCTLRINGLNPVSVKLISVQTHLFPLIFQWLVLIYFAKIAIPNNILHFKKKQKCYFYLSSSDFTTNLCKKRCGFLVTFLENWSNTEKKRKKRKKRIQNWFLKFK